MSGAATILVDARHRIWLTVPEMRALVSIARPGELDDRR